jgi:antirestriction protein ArdC
VEGLPEKFFEKGNTPQLTEPEKDKIAEDIIRKSGAKINFVHLSENIATVLTGSTANYYNSLKDEITLADRKQFKGKEAFYKTAFHELGHWTGYRTRLNRPLANPNNS